MAEELWASLSSMVGRVRSVHVLLSRDMEETVTILHNSARRTESERDEARDTLAAYREALEKVVETYDAHSETHPGEDWRAWLDTATKLSDACTEGRVLLASPDPGQGVVERLKAGQALSLALDYYLETKKSWDNRSHALKALQVALTAYKAVGLEG